MTSSLSDTSTRPRVLVWGLTNNMAGTEGVIRNVATVCRDRVAFDFLTMMDVPNHLDFAEADGNRVMRIPKDFSHQIAYARALKRFFLDHGSEYCAVWANACSTINVDALLWGNRCGIPKRILHSHSSQFSATVFSRLLANYNWRRVAPCLTDRWACSPAAGEYMFGERDFEVVPNAIPFQRYVFSEALRSEMRRALNIPESAFVVGMVGRMTKMKNHRFMIDLFRSSHELCDAYLVIVGDGELREELEGLVGEYGLTDRIRFTGPTSHTERYYSCFDALALPSDYEGLPLVMLEAQANGLPIVLSEGVSDDGVISNAVKHVSLDKPNEWCANLLRADRGSFSLNERSAQFRLEDQADLFIDRFVG